MVDLVSRVDSWSLVRYCYITREVHPRVSYYTEMCTSTNTRVVHQKEREVVSLLGAKGAVFLPGFFANCLSEGDLWFTSDNWTIILSAHSLSVEIKI